MASPLVSRPSAGSSPSCSSVTIPTTSPLCQPISGQLSPFSPHTVVPPPSQPFRHDSTENLPTAASAGPASDPFSDSDHCLATLAFPSTTWSSCPSPQRTTPRSGSAPGLSPPASVSGLECHRWPILPPISPVKGEK